ncbi:MAG TPA: phosphoribulokinase [Nocardioides bacterium]|uniref:phosphoribulokinase n=1 Tax=uncultured Nocardioides sp. TaxID=198441 RepID=UPI000EDF8510|nr:phosphoribulokinase [uncultured Nocardioides sp.]HCB02970.1 phosphoribulokinase [Nocardioides sp.]HRD60081.1 phosphoribulokinase [Nocardioides sp.]HRK44232.1 phosphoribulokinase [Nocardioides sp.]
MPDKSLRLALLDQARPRPVMLAIAGDSAAGKTTLTRGLTEALGPDRCLSICADDYHRYDREERRDLPFTPLHPDCNHIDILEQHLQLLALGRPILKPNYDHATGTFTRPTYVEPTEFIVVEGLHPLATKLSRACFDVTVFLDPPEAIRHQWKIERDCTKRGYERDQVTAELERREPESAAYIRPQRRWADIVARFAPISGRDDPPGTPLSAELLLRPTIQHPSLADVLPEDRTDTADSAMHLKIIRDADGTPTDCLHVHGHASDEEARQLEKAIWAELDVPGGPPDSLGRIGPDQRSEPLAITQLILLFHLLAARAGRGTP